MRLSARHLNRATLDRQWLLERRGAGVVDAVRAICAIQAQSPASPYLALWNRVDGFDARALDEAFASQQVVKATLMRMTLHAAAAEDYPAFQRAMSVRLKQARLTDGRFASTGLTEAEADALVAAAVAYADEPRTNAEIEAVLAERAGRVEEPGAWWALRAFAPFVHAPTDGAWSFGERPTYLGARSAPFAGTDEEAVAVLVRRYLEAFGPASAADIGQFTGLLMGPIRAALTSLADELDTLEGPDGRPVHDLGGMPVPEPDRPVPPRLMPMWDSVLFAYRDRSRVIPDAYRRAVIRTNGDTLPTVLVDGLVAGVWRPTADGGAIEVTAFHALDPDTWAALEAEAIALRAFVADRQPDVYRRYGRWWTDLPAADVRLLGGGGA